VIDPKSIEQGLIGSILTNNDAFVEAAALVNPDDFLYQAHRAIWRIMAELSEAGEPFDAVTVAEEAAALRLSASMGGASYQDILALVSLGTPTDAWKSYARQIRERAFARRLRDAATALNAAIEEGADPERALAAHEALLLSMRRPDTGRDGWVAVGDTADGIVAEYDARVHQGGGSSGIPTGFHDLDKRTGGLQPADLIVLGARPSMGKSSFALCIARNVARAGHTVGMFSLEMSRDAVATVLLCQIARVQSDQIRGTSLTPDERERLESAREDLARMRIQVDEKTGMSIAELRMRARRLAAACPENAPLGLLIVDYLQLARSPNARRGGSKAEEVGEVSMGLKQIARELRVPVIALAQLSRGLESRPIKERRPINSDLRDSGQIEQDADVILFLFREEVYDPTTAEKGIAEVIVTKQRLGALGTTRLRFTGPHQRFDSLDERHDMRGYY
jgi:replicative DNA helicase